MKFFDWKCPDKKCGTEGTTPEYNKTTHCPFCHKEVVITKTFNIEAHE